MDAVSEYPVPLSLPSLAVKVAVLVISIVSLTKGRNYIKSTGKYKNHTIRAYGYSHINHANDCSAAVIKEGRNRVSNIFQLIILGSNSRIICDNKIMQGACTSIFNA